MIDQKLVEEALARFARSADGRVFYLGLQKVMMGVPSENSEGALRENHGRRKFAFELMDMMAKAMTESASDDGIGSGDRPIIFQHQQPVAVSGQRGAKRRVGPAAEQPD